MIGLKRFSLQGLVRHHRTFSTAKEAIVPSFKGRATVNGTFDFVRKSALPLHHQFATSKLTISPIIHGPPSLHTAAERNKPYIEALTRRAVVVNRSNCIVVYQHYPEDEPYYATNLATLFTDPANDVSRDQVVIVANIGLATTRSEVYKRLSNACQKTGMEMIDMVMFEINEAANEDHVEETILALNALCEQGSIQSYGIQVCVAPYTYHKPALKQQGPAMGLPLTIEDLYLKQFEYADMVAYPVSPTIAVPSTYPMLDPNPEDCDMSNPEEAKFLGESEEKSRTYTRIALNPLTCMVGGKENIKYDSAMVLEGRRRLQALQLEDEIAEVRHTLLQSLKKKIKRAHEKGKEFVPTEEDLMAEHLAKMNEQGLQEVLKELTAQQNADPHAEAYRPLKAGESADSPRILDITGMDLVTGLNAPAMEEYFVDALDELCPPLQSTPLLQDKALRVVLSVGIDVVLVDAERSAMLGKFNLKPADLLTDKDTDAVFEYFKLPYGDERDAEDPYFQLETGDFDYSSSEDEDGLGSDGEYTSGSDESNDGESGSDEESGSDKDKSAQESGSDNDMSDLDSESDSESSSEKKGDGKNSSSSSSGSEGEDTDSSDSDDPDNKKRPTPTRPMPSPAEK